jgi:hypothetical protein
MVTCPLEEMRVEFLSILRVGVSPPMRGDKASGASGRCGYRAG